MFGLGPRKPKVKRSPEWPRYRKAWLAQHPSCANCGDNRKLEVHHLKPVHLWPELELDTTNYLTLCEEKSKNCHWNRGHLLDWKSYNVRAVEDGQAYLLQVENRPYAK